WGCVTGSRSLARVYIVIRRSADGPTSDRLGTGFQPMQASPWHAGLAGLRFLRLLFASRFSAMLLSPSLSASGKADDLWKIPPTSILVVPGIRCQLLRRPTRPLHSGSLALALSAISATACRHACRVGVSPLVVQVSLSQS